MMRQLLRLCSLLLAVSTMFVEPCFGQESGVVLARPSMELMKSANFRVYYPEGRFELAQRSIVPLHAMVAEMKDRLALGDDRVVVIICETPEEFTRFAGRRLARHNVSGVAQSSKGVIVVKAPYLASPGSDYEGTLRHEMMHVLVARNTELANVPRWLNEGMAMYFSGEHRWTSIMRVGKMYLQNAIIDYRYMNMAFADPHDERVFSDAYAQALSLTRFLINDLGEETFFAMLRGLDELTLEESFARQAQTSPYQYYVKWRRSLWKLGLISATLSGLTLFQAGALLLLLAYWRKQRSNRAILRRWEEEDKDAWASPWSDEDEQPEHLNG